MSTKFVVYTELGQETSGGVMIKHIIAPIDVSAIPNEEFAMHETEDEAIQFVAVDEPENMDRFIGIYNCYSAAIDALRPIPSWRSARTKADHLRDRALALLETTNEAKIGPDLNLILQAQINHRDDEAWLRKMIALLEEDQQ